MKEEKGRVLVSKGKLGAGRAGRFKLVRVGPSGDHFIDATKRNSIHNTASIFVSLLTRRVWEVPCNLASSATETRTLMLR